MVLKYRTLKKDKVITLYSNRATSTKTSPTTIDDDITISAAGTLYVTPPSVSFTAAPAGGSTATGYAILNANGRVESIFVTNNGSGYTSTPAITITTVVVEPTGYCEMITDGVESIVVANGGAGYTTAPTVNITPTNGNGNGATAIATLGFPITGFVTIVSGGTGYSPNTTISIEGGGGGDATATCVVTGGVITAVTITSFGKGYTSAPSIVANGGACTGFSATLFLATNGYVVSVAMTNKGTGYITPPTISFSGSSSIDATAGVVMNNKVNRIIITNGGFYGATGPTLTITGGGFSTQATGTVDFANGSVASITLTDGGTGYTDTPSLVWAGGLVPPGSGATATCSLSQGRTFEYVFEIPHMELSGNAKMGVISLASVLSTTDQQVYNVRCKEISSHNNWDNMYGWGVIYCQQNLNMRYNNDVYFSIAEKELRQITLSVNEDLGSRDTGIVSSQHFVISLHIIDFDEEEVQDKFMGTYKENNQPPQLKSRFY